MIRIGNLGVGGGEPTRIVAEMGTLHHHLGYDKNMAITSDFFKAGADLVKTQLIYDKTAWWASKAGSVRYTEHAMNGWGLPGLENDRWRKYFCSANTIGPTFASIFDYRFLELSDIMPAWKLGYKAIGMRGLVENVLATRLPIIASVTKPEEIDPSFDLHLFVQPTYPVPREEIVIKMAYDGLSVHHRQKDIIKAVLMTRPAMLELHVMGDGADGPDTQFALTLEEFKEICDFRDRVTFGEDVGQPFW